MGSPLVSTISQAYGNGWTISKNRVAVFPTSVLKCRRAVASLWATNHGEPWASPSGLVLFFEHPLCGETLPCLSSPARTRAEHGFAVSEDLKAGKRFSKIEQSRTVAKILRRKLPVAGSNPTRAL